MNWKLELFIAIGVFSVSTVFGQLPFTEKMVLEKVQLNCPENSLFCNPISQFSYSDSWENYNFERSIEFCMDGKMETIGFWGISGYYEFTPDEWYECFGNELLKADIKIFEYNSEGILNTIASFYNIEPIVEYSGYNYDGFSVYKYMYSLDSQINCSRGIINITLQDDNWYCGFKWLNSPTGLYNPDDEYTDDYPYSLFITGEPNSCLAPVKLSATKNQSNSATVSWTDLNNASDWQITLSSIDSGEEPTSSIYDTDTNLFTITGLNPQKNYQFKVQSTCSVADSSQWSQPRKFITSCSEIVDYPVVESFEADMDLNCWTIFDANVDGVSWRRNKTIMEANTGNFAILGSGNTDDYLISPQFFIDSTFEFSWFDKVEYSQSMNSYEVLLSTTGMDIADFTHYLGNFNCTNTFWKKYRIYLDDFMGQTVYIAFHQYYSKDIKVGFGFDQISMNYKPACLPVQEFKFDDITTTTAQISWLNTNNNNTWNIKYADKDFIVGQVTQVQISENPYTIEGLSDGTCYAIYIQSQCTNDTSEWEGPYYFTTLCAVDTTITESFENDFPPNCWYNLNDGNGSSLWSKTSGLAHDGNFSAMASSHYEKSKGKSWLITSNIFVDKNKALSFYAAVDDLTPCDTRLAVKISTESNQENLEAYKDLLIIEGYGTTHETFTYYTIDLSKYLGNNIYLAFVMLDSYVNYWLLDDITFLDCYCPNSFYLDSCTSESASIHWDSPNENFEIEYGPYGFKPGEGIIKKISTSSITLNDLEPAHTYQVYVKSACNNQDTSSWSLPFNFTTKNVPYTAITKFPYYESFEDQDDFIYWQIQNSKTDDLQSNNQQQNQAGKYYSWMIINPENAVQCEFRNYIHDGLRSAFIYSASNEYDWLVSPEIYIPENGAALKFVVTNNYYNNWDFVFSNLNLKIFSDGIWTELPIEEDADASTDFYSDTGNIFFSNVELNSFASKIIKLAFVYKNTNNFFLAIDRIIITENAHLNTETDILTFSISNEAQPSIIHRDTHSIDVFISSNYNMSSLISSFTLSKGATAKVNNEVQVSGQTANNFTNPIIYKIIAEDTLIVQDWTITAHSYNNISTQTNDLWVYPNPFINTLTIEAKIPINKTIEIYDSKMLKMTKVEMTGNAKTIELTHFEKGLYYLFIKTESDLIIQKIIKL